MEATRHILHVLIVEDDKLLARLIEHHVGPIREAFPDAIITVVHEWPDARKYLETDPAPNVVLLDLTVPGSELLETIARVDALEERSALVIITGHKPEEFMGLFKSKVEVLLKTPSLWNPGTIMRAIVRALERKEIEQQDARFAGIRDIINQLHSHGYGPSQPAT